MRPRIAVTTSLWTGGRHGLLQVGLGAPYVAAVEAPGGCTLLLTPAHDPASLREIIGIADGLVLTGGEDVDPARYGEEPHPRLETVNPARDAMEFAALAAALGRGIPVLAICRGIQLLNVALGGTLYQDLPSQRSGDLVHAQTAPVGHRWHPARVEPGSGLERIFGASELFINSFHHQGIDRLAPGLRATVWAEDGLVEGVEAEAYPWVYGVQWHPERGEANAPGDPRDPDRRLLWAFVQAAREWRDGDGQDRSTKWSISSSGKANSSPVPG